MYKLSNVKISAAPTTAFNSLLAAKIRGRHFSVSTRGLSWMQASSFVNPDSAPRGQRNPSYTGGVTMDKLDPTSDFGIASSLGSFRNDLPSVAYTRHFVALEAVGAVAVQLAEWWREYAIITQQALQAQASIKSAKYDTMDSYRDVRYHEGAITQFLIATGEIYGPEIAYPEYDKIDIQRIADAVYNMLTPYCASLDIEAFKLGYSKASQQFGIGTAPGMGQSMSVISAQSFDMFRNPWHRILRNKAAREICRPILEDRIQAALDTYAVDEESLEGKEDVGVFQLIESVGSIWLPINYKEGLQANVQRVFDWADGLTPLSTLDYQSDLLSLDKQLYTNGDLVKALFVDETVDPTETSSLSVLLSPLAVETYIEGGTTYNALVVGNGNQNAIDSGALCSISPARKDAINLLCGTQIAVYKDATTIDLDSSSTIDSRAGTSYLPNGTLTMGSLADCTALDWFDFLTWMRDALPNDLRILLERTGRAMRTLPKLSSVSLRDTNGLLTDMVTSGVRDGYLANISLSFNTERPERAEMDGPLIVNTSWEASFPQGGNIDTAIATNTGNWDTIDTSASMSFVSPFGNSVSVTEIPSRFVGNWDSGRMSFFLPALLQTSGVSGTSVTNFIAESLLSYPGVKPHNGDIKAISPKKMMTRLYNLDGEKIENLAGYMDDQGGLSALAGRPVANGLVSTLESLTCWENEHPLHGFVRGLAAFTPKKMKSSNARVEDTLYRRNRATHAAMGSDFSSVVKKRGSSTVNLATTLMSDIYADGKMQAETLADSTISGLEASFYMKHLWDINRINCLGLGNTRWKGTSISSVLPHPYARDPISVFNWTMKLGDINTAIDQLRTTERQIHAYTVISGPDTDVDQSADDIIDYPVVGATTYVHDTNEGRIEGPTPGCGSGVLRSGGSDRWPAKIAGSLLQIGALNGGSVSNSGSLFDPVTSANTTMNHETLEGLNPIQASMSLDNGIGVKDNPFSTGGTNATDTVDLFAPTWPMVGGLVKASPGAPLRLEGETVFCAGDVFTDADNHPSVTIVTDGVGLAPRSDMLTFNMLDVSPWLARTYTELVPDIRTNFVGQMPPALDSAEVPGNAKGRYQMVLRGVRNSRVGSIASGVGSNAVSVMRGPAVVANLANNLWFRRGLVLSTEKARKRREGMPNPWIRGEGEAGLTHQRYTPLDVSPVTRVVQDRMQALSKRMSSGLETSLFMELQIAN